MCVCVCVCVCPRGHEKQTSPTAVQFLYMALAIDINDGHGLSNEARG